MTFENKRDIESKRKDGTLTFLDPIFGMDVGKLCWEYTGHDEEFEVKELLEAPARRIKVTQPTKNWGGWEICTCLLFSPPPHKYFEVLNFNEIVQDIVAAGVPKTNKEIIVMFSILENMCRLKERAKIIKKYDKNDVELNPFKAFKDEEIVFADDRFFHVEYKRIIQMAQLYFFVPMHVEMGNWYERM